MKITFLRRGHANNSSSSHSLIFVDDISQIRNNATTEFGWSLFTCSSVDAKKNYLLACLKRSYEMATNITCNYCDDIKYDSLQKMKDTLFAEWVTLHFSDVKFDLSVISEVTVDHQSQFIFPLYRNKQRGINKELARTVIEEVVENNYVLLGGNDNSGDVHPLKDLDRPANEDFHTFWVFCKDVSPSHMAEYDNKTGEFVVAGDNYMGRSLMKVRF